MANERQPPDRRPRPLGGGRYATLLVVVLLTVLLYSLVGSHEIIRWLLDLSSLAILMAALRSSPPKHRGRFVVILVLGFATVVAGGVGGSLSVDMVYPVGAGLRGVFLGYLVTVILLDISTRDRVTRDTVLGACCVYILLGLAWGSAYALVEWIQPGSFELDGHVEAGHRRDANESDLVYFSLITMTTVGYGDLAPSAQPARTIAALEALVAQLFLAIVIARFVAMEITFRMSARFPSGPRAREHDR